MEAVRSGEDAAVAEELCCSHSEAAVGSLGEGGELAEQKLLDQRLEDAAPNLLGGSLAASEEAQGELASQPSTPPRSFAAAEDSTEDQGDPAEQLQPGLPMLNMGEANNDDFVARTPVKGGDPSEDRPLSATSSVSAPDSPGNLRVWISPPPSDRMWVGFMEEPNMEMVANPLVGARGIKHTKVASKVSQWVVGKLRGMISNLYVLPACTDMRVPGLLGCPGLQDRVAVPRALPESTTPQSESEPSSPTCVDNQAPSPFSTPMATPMDNPIPSPNGGLTPSGKP
eukprot:gene28485-35320_t